MHNRSLPALIYTRQYQDLLKQGTLQEIRSLFEQKKLEINSPCYTDTSIHSYWFPLHFACIYKRIDVVEYLVSQNADMEKTDSEGFKAFMLCASNGFLEGLRFFKDHHCALDSENYLEKQTPLHLAIKAGEAECVRFLLENGCNPNGVPRDSVDTSLYLAILGKTPKIVRLLLDHGADPFQAVSFQMYRLKPDLLQACQDTGLQECAEMLFEAGLEPGDHLSEVKQWYDLYTRRNIARSAAGPCANRVRLTAPKPKL